MKLIVVRHTKVNIPKGICYGQSDVDITSQFIAESRIIAKKLPISTANIYCSPLKRCRKLAEAVFPDKDIIFDDRLKELNFGDWELKSWDEIYASEEGKRWMNTYQTRNCLNGESYLEMLQRVKYFFDDLFESKINEVVIFTHAGVIRILKSMVDNIPVSDLFESFKPPYGSITELKWNGRI